MYVISSAVYHCNYESDLAVACHTDIASHKTATHSPKHGMAGKKKKMFTQQNKSNKQTNRHSSPKKLYCFYSLWIFSQCMRVASLAAVRPSLTLHTSKKSHDKKDHDCVTDADHCPKLDAQLPCNNLCCPGVAECGWECQGDSVLSLVSVHNQ